MAPSTNFKTYETQARLLSALVASLGPDFRFDYAKISRYYGSGATESALEHKFRAARAQAGFLRGMMDGVKGDKPTEVIDPADYAIWDITRDDIQAVFGASTVEGLAYQFRSIKRGAKVLKDALAKGENPAVAFNKAIIGGSGAGAGAPATPSGRAPSSSKRARTSKPTPSGSGAGPASKRRRTINLDSDVEDGDSTEVDYDALDTTPTKLGPKVKTTPKKNPGALLPRSAWAKPAKPAARKPARPVPIAPAPPRPATPSYTMAPIPGVIPSTVPATVHGYYSYPAPPVVGSGSSSAANSPAMNTTIAMRRSSTLSAGSGSFPGSPAASTPMLAFTEPATTQVNNQAAIMNMNTSMASDTSHSQYPPVPAPTFATGGMSPYTVFDSASPSGSASEACTPQAAAPAYPITAPCASATAAAATPSFTGGDYYASPSASSAFSNSGSGYDSVNLYSNPGSFPDGSSGYQRNKHAAQNHTASNSNNNNGHYTSGYDEVEAAYASQINFGGPPAFEQEDWEDAADC